MKFTILGSCSGTEPMPGRRHASVALQASGKTYLLDAGDGCGYTMHFSGIDARGLEAVFLSHPHPDHVSGLAYLFFLIGKLHKRGGTVWEKPLEIYTPSPDPVTGALLLNGRSERLRGRIVTRPVQDGTVFSDDVLRLSARHNRHMGESEPPYHSFSYLLELEGKKIVYSGDVKSVTELSGWLDCDLLFMETGHHDPTEVAQYLASLAAPPKKTVYVHHGRTVLADPEGCKARIRAILGESADVAFDGMTVEL